MLSELKKLTLSELETKLTNGVARLSPWLAPIPTAYLVGRATLLHLAWPWPIAAVAAVIIECLGLAAVNTALELREYNASKRKSDPTAPFALGAVLVGVYVVVATGLTVALDIFPALAVYSPAIFPLLSLAGVTIIALRSDHGRRLAAIESVKAERQGKRQGNRQSTGNEPSSQVSNISKNDTLLDAMRQGKQAKKDAKLDSLLTVLVDSPGAGVSDLARAIGASRQTVYTYLDELETSGKIHRNGDGVRVL